MVQTCSACPSQWSGWDIHDNEYYLRYRWGYGVVLLGGDHEALMIASFRHGDSLDGFIELEKFAELAGLDVSDAGGAT